MIMAVLSGEDYDSKGHYDYGCISHSCLAL